MKRLRASNNQEEFKKLLHKISLMDEKSNLDLRFKLIIQLMNLAIGLNYPVGMGTDNKNPGVSVAYIELPTGQISWHMPNDNNIWDGHSTEEKDKRIEEFLKK